MIDKRVWSKVFFIVGTQGILKGLFSNIKFIRLKRKFIILTIFIWFLFGGYLLVSTFPYFFSSNLLPPKLSLFDVKAETEVVSLKGFNGYEIPYWKMDNVAIHDGCDDDFVTMSGTLKFSPNVKATIVKVERNLARIRLDMDDFNSSGIFNETVLSDCVDINIRLSSDAYTFPFDGVVIIGQSIKSGGGSVPMLLHGELSIADRRILSGDYYQNRPVKISLGDRFYISGMSKPAVGFIHISNNKGLEISYRANGRKAIIERYKSESIKITNGFWDKVANDDALMIFWACFLAFTRFLFSSLISYFREESCGK
ncbi:hypothetical protein N6393_004347 [Vibrio vulnificus]|nr:hypothetical protein [Vibrio vulnificus]